jgi:hypothetical protein
MRITENTPARLILRDRTYWFSIVCFATTAILATVAVSHERTDQLLGTGFFLLCGFLTLRAGTIVFDKSARRCEIRRLDIVSFKRIQLAFDVIVDIRVEPSPGGDDPGTIGCRLSVVTATATLPLSAVYTPGLEHYNRMRDAILDMLYAGTPRPPASDPAALLAVQGNVIAAASVLLRSRDGMDLRGAIARAKELRDWPSP